MRLTLRAGGVQDRRAELLIKIDFAVQMARQLHTKAKARPHWHWHWRWHWQRAAPGLILESLYWALDACFGPLPLGLA